MTLPRFPPAIRSRIPSRNNCTLSSKITPGWSANLSPHKNGSHVAADKVQKQCTGKEEAYSASQIVTRDEINRVADELCGGFVECEEFCRSVLRR